MDFSGGLVVKNPPASAGDTSSVPSPGRLLLPWDSEACAPQLLKPVCLESTLSNKRSHHRKKPMHHNWRVGAALTQLEKACAQQGRASAAKSKINEWMNKKENCIKMTLLKLPKIGQPLTASFNMLYSPLGGVVGGEVKIVLYPLKKNIQLIFEGQDPEIY